MKWISVNDRRPEDETEMLLVVVESVKPIMGKTIFSCTDGYYSNRFQFWDGERRNECKVTHWAPLPEPPEVNNEKN